MLRRADGIADGGSDEVNGFLQKAPPGMEAKVVAAPVYRSKTGCPEPFHPHRLAWIWAALAAAALNLVLFTLMPYLVTPVIEKAPFQDLVPQVTVIRLPRPNPPVIPRTEPPRLEQPETEQPPPPPPAPGHPPPARLQLPFDINPHLPVGPQTLALPPMAPARAPTPTPGPFPMSDLDQPLTTLVRIPPVYPLAAQRRGIEGWVRVRFVVSEQGTVESVRVLEAQPQGIFDDAVLTCVSGWRFSPGTVAGIAVKIEAETIVRFELQ